MTLAAPAATVVIVGIPAVDRVQFTASVARRKGLTVKLSRRMNRVYPRAIRLVESALVDVRSIVTQSLLLTEFELAFATAAKREGLKVIVRPSATPESRPRPDLGADRQPAARAHDGLANRKLT